MFLCLFLVNFLTALCFLWVDLEEPLFTIMWATANKGLKLGWWWWLGYYLGYYQFFLFGRFPSHPWSTFSGANFGISLCLWIEVDKRALIALPCTLSLLPLLFSTPIASPSLFLSIFHLGMGWGPLVINKTGRDGESVCVRGGVLVRNSQA